MEEVKKTKEEMLEVIDASIKKMEEKDFNMYFYVFDTKGYSNGELEYIYQTAFDLKELGYKVTMIHSEEDFVGVEDWLGKEYAELPHKNIAADNVELSPCDFIFIPEIFTEVMAQTKKLNCKRVLIMQNHRFLCDFMPVGVSPRHYNIYDVVTTTNSNKEKLEEYFGSDIKVSVVRPSIKGMFRYNNSARKLIVNVLSDKQNDVNQIVKPFYWKYPIYKWVSFRHVTGVSKEVFSDALREAAITISINTNPSFDYKLLEAVKCGGIVLAKIPEEPTDWMLTEDGDLINSVIWFEKLEDVPMMLFSIIRTWTLDEMPKELTEECEKMRKYITEEFSEKKQLESIEETYGEFVTRRKSEFEEVRRMVENNTLN